MVKKCKYFVYNTKGSARTISKHMKKSIAENKVKSLKKKGISAKIGSC